MKTAPLHPRERERLEALKHLEVLDSVPERDFDEITALASQICQTPIALVSLVDESRQWFKSKVGIEAMETPRDWAFCAHAILGDGIFQVKDSQRDERFADNPLVTGEAQVKFYAGAPLLSPDGLPIGTLCVIDHQPRDLSPEQLRALAMLSNQVNRLLYLRTQLQLLRSSNEKLFFQRAAFENMQEGVVLQDATGRIVDFNPSALRVLGLTADEIQGRTSMDPRWRSTREDGSDFPGDEHPAMVALRTGQNQRNVIMGVHTPLGKPRWISINAIPLHLNSGGTPTHVVSTFTDITEQKAAQQAILHAAKMSSLGEMAGGIAHEINTPLAVICATAEQLLRQVGEGRIDPMNLDKKIRRIDETGHKIANIVRGLRSFARDSEQDPWQSTRLEPVVQETLALCTEKFKNHQIDLSLVVKSDAEVSCIPTQISQVLLNLLNNAYDALERLKEKWVRVEIEAKAGIVQLSVMDSGFGIASDIQEKIMQPFFTTKEIGKGNGLGLSISKGLVESFHGRLYYDPSEARTCFRLELPRRASQPGSAG